MIKISFVFILLPYLLISGGKFWVKKKYWKLGISKSWNDPHTNYKTCKLREGIVKFNSLELYTVEQSQLLLVFFAFNDPPHLSPTDHLDPIGSVDDLFPISIVIIWDC